jgi:hypothetical protein
MTLNTNAKELFFTAINSGLSAIKGIAEPDKKAMAYANIAQALALSGLIDKSAVVSDNAEVSTETKTEQKTEPKGKEALRPAPKAKKEETPPPPKVDIDSVPAATDAGDTWTDEAVVEKAESIEKLKSYQAVYTEEQIVQRIKMFSERQIESLDGILPYNIDEFITFLDTAAILKQYEDAYGDEAILQCVDMFSEGQYKSLDDITPANIDAFLAYLESLANQGQE